MSPRTLALVLTQVPGIGGKSIARALVRNGLLGRTPAEFLRLAPEVWREEYRFSARSAKWLSENVPTLVRTCQDLERRLDALGVTWVTQADAHYPALAEQMDPDAPGVLYLFGNTKLLESKTFCVLSSRSAKQADHDLIESLTEEGVLAGEVLVCGQDRPEYQRSAIVPLRWGSPRILGLDRGMFHVLGQDLKEEAFRAARLWRYEFDPRVDLVVSLVPPDQPYVRGNNLRRDRLVGSLSKRLDFVQIAPGGNMEALAKLALGSGRPVRVSDRILDYRRWVQEGAKPIRT